MLGVGEEEQYQIDLARRKTRGRLALLVLVAAIAVVSSLAGCDHSAEGGPGSASTHKS